MNKKVIIIGAGGHAKVIADIIKVNHDELVGFLDDDSAKINKIIFDNKKVLGGISTSVDYPDCEYVIGIGNNSTRAKLAAEYPGLKYHTAIHPSAIIGGNVEIMPGTVVMPGSVINTGTKIGKHCIVNTHVTIEHDNTIGDFVHLSPSATLCGTVTVGSGSWICTGAAVINNISIAEKTIVGAGAVVLKNIEQSGNTYIGVPAKRL